MYRGTILFKCTHCGNKFMGFDIEYRATIFSYPPCCPRCNSIRTRPLGLMGFLLQGAYKSIWDETEQAKNEPFQPLADS